MGGRVPSVDLVRRDALGRVLRRGAQIAQILHRPGHGVPQVACGAQRPIGVAQELAGDEHDVGLAVADVWSACAGAEIIPTAAVATRASRRTACENGT